jgi:phosphopantothenoylcysteine decarboxylase/phosphopantothenate--cysteine ligase
MPSPPHVVVGITGSIAAYKAAELVRMIIRRDWDASVVMTRSATKFITELTMRTLARNPVGLDMFAPTDEWQVDHISFASRADVLLIAPCTANVIAKLANGISDDLLTCTALATHAPIVVAPAMHENMWNHPATQANVELLKSRGVRVVDVAAGELACGATGKGRMADLDCIMQAVAELIDTP